MGHHRISRISRVLARLNYSHIPAAGEHGLDAAEEGGGLAGEHGAHDDVDLAVDATGRPSRSRPGSRRGERGRGAEEGHGRSEKDCNFDCERGGWRGGELMGSENAIARLQVHGGA